MRILLAVDGSPASQAAVSAVARRPWPSRSSVRVVSVAQVGSAASELAVMAVADLVASEKAARDAIDRAADAIARPGIEVDGAVLRGEPQLEIVDEARRWGADLVVLGTHGRRGVQRLLVGSVAEHVVRHAPCSVEVAREPAEERS